MRLLQTIKPEDVDSAALPHDYSTYTPRPAVRAVVFDGLSVGLILVQKHDYYMLPGGGIDTDEEQSAALIRELHEELGCEVRITNEIGSITIYNSRWCTKQTDYCYTAELVQKTTARMPTAFETAEAHRVVWFDTIDEAITHMRDAQPDNIDGKLVQARDLLFLETTKETSQQ